MPNCGGGDPDRVMTRDHCSSGESGQIFKILIKQSNTCFLLLYILLLYILLLLSPGFATKLADAEVLVQVLGGIRGFKVSLSKLLHLFNFQYSVNVTVNMAIVGNIQGSKFKKNYFQRLIRLVIIGRAGIFLILQKPTLRGLEKEVARNTSESPQRH